MTDVIGGQVHMIFSVIPPVLQHIRTGKLRAIAVTSAVRTAMLPEVPSVGESGHGAIESTLSYGIVAPAGTAEAILRETQAHIAKAVAAADFRERLVAEGTDPLFATGTAFAAVLQAETRKWAAVIKTAGVRAD
jgi:tripartite-type tricarboxylate transporter receptor subunit TctC